MSARSVSTHTIVNPVNAESPPIRVAVRDFGPVQRLTLSQGPNLVTLPVGDTPRLADAITEAVS